MFKLTGTAESCDTGVAIYVRYEIFRIEGLPCYEFKITLSNGDSLMTTFSEN